jgi:hypothetical protein
MNNKVKADYIKKALIEFLEKKYKNKTITTEIGVWCNNSYRIADVVLANGHTYAFEIKSEADNLKRLDSQINAFQQYFDYVYIVYWKDKFVINNLNKNVGLIECFNKNKEIKFRVIKKAYINNLQKDNLVEFLWNSELEYLIKNYFDFSFKNLDKEKMRKLVLSNFTKREILKIYRFFMKYRFKKGYETYLETKDLSFSFVKNKKDYKYVNYLTNLPL